MEAASSSPAHSVIAVGGLAVLGIVVFASTAHVPLLADDYTYLERVQTPGWWHSAAIWNPRGTAGNHLFRPVLFLWFGLLHGTAGLHSFPYHVATGLVVLAAAVLVGLVAGRLGLRTGAYAAAAVYGLHASMAVPIAWTAAASSPLATALALGALYLLLTTHLRPAHVVVACVLFLIALMTREVIAVTPAVLMMGRFLIEPDLALSARIKRSMLVSAPLWGVLVGYLVVRRIAGFHSTTGPYEQRLSTHAFHNLGQLMAFATEFGYANRSGTFVALFWITLSGLCIFIALHARLYQGLIGLAWVLVGVLPVIFLATHHMEYYYVDYALPGLAIAIGVVVQSIIDAMPDRSRILFAAACLAGLVALNSYTARKEVDAYLSPVTLRTNLVVARVRRENPHPAPGSVVVLPITYSESAFGNYLALIRVVYDDPSLQIRYTVK